MTTTRTTTTTTTTTTSRIVLHLFIIHHLISILFLRTEKTSFASFASPPTFAAVKSETVLDMLDTSAHSLSISFFNSISFYPILLFSLSLCFILSFSLCHYCSFPLSSLKTFLCSVQANTFITS